MNTDGGYITNQYTGENIRPIINSRGDTIQTGRPITIEPIIIDTDTILPPNVVSAGDPIVYSANQHITKVSGNLTVIPVDSDQLERAPLKIPESNFTETSRFHPDHFIINTIGDTIVTGTPVEIKGNIVEPAAPRIATAVQPRMRDNAKLDIQYLDVTHGLNDSYVYSIRQDPDGNFWLTTNMGGLTRYDGERFVTYTREEGLSGNMAGALLIDQNDHLWIATTDGGLSFFDGFQFTHYTVANGFINDSISSLFEDSRGNIWIGTSAGVTLYNGETFTHYTENEGLKGTRVVAIYEDQSGTMWFGTSNSGINRFDGNEFTYLTIENGLPDTGVRAIEEDDSGDLWLGTWAGVAKYDGSSLTVYSAEDGLTDGILSDIYKDKNGNLWFATVFDGLIKHDGETFTVITESDGLNSNGVNTIYEDENGILWLGMNGGGINRFNQNSFKHFVKTGELDHRSPLALLEDRSGNYWFSNRENGISRYDGDTFEHFTVEKGLSGNSVWSLLEDSEGNIWIGTNGDGVSKFDGETFTQYTVQNNLPFHTIENMIEDEAGNIWFGVWNGVVKFDGDRFYNYTMESGLSANQVWSLYNDSEGNLWFGTYSGGAIKFDGEYFTTFTEKEGLSGNNVFAIVEDDHGNIWLGTDGNGLNKFDGEQFEYYTTSEGLANNIIRSLLKDREGNIWAATDGGLSKIEITDNHPSEKVNITNYGIESGLKGTDFSFTSSLLDSKNRAWWGTGQSLVMLDLNNFENSEDPPRLHLAGIEINGEHPELDREISKDDNKYAGIVPFYKYPEGLENRYNQNHLTFHVAGIDWLASHRVRYSYKLDGLDDNWSAPTSDPQIDYRNLSHGEYTFNVRAAGESGIWSEPVQYAFTILPPWWHSWWAYGMYSILILCFLFGLDRYRHRYIRQRQKLLEEMIQLRTEELQHEKKKTEQQAQKLKELDAEKNRFFANISHEFRTPLTLTIAPLENLKSKKYGPFSPDGERQINMAIRNSKRLMRLVGQLLDLAKFEANLFKLKPEPAKLNHYLRYIAIRFIGAAERNRVTFNIQIPEETIRVNIDPEQFEKVISNLLSNAFKFTPEGGEVSIALHSEKDKAIIKVKDSGAGISEEHLPRLFDRFYQVEKSELQPGSGIGLALVKEITEQHGGQVEVKSKIDEGTEFFIYLSVIQSEVSEENLIEKPYEIGFDPEEELISVTGNRTDKIDQLKDDNIKTIMVIDDNRDIRSYLREQFSGDFNVVEAASGKEALEHIHGLLPDVIVSDIMMPDGDGFSLLKELRSDPETDFLPVILLTARAEAEDKLQGLGIGADDYITKPFSMEEVAARVQNLIKRQKRLQRHFANLSTNSSSQKTVLHPDPIKAESADDIYLEQIRATVQEKMHDEDFGVEDLANLMFQSRTHLFRKMKDLTGESPSGFIKRMRLERGAELLVQKTGTVSEIAYSTGFRSVAQFSKSFRDHFGKTPTAYAAIKNL